MRDIEFICSDGISVYIPDNDFASLLELVRGLKRTARETTELVISLRDFDISSADLGDLFCCMHNTMKFHTPYRRFRKRVARVLGYDFIEDFRARCVSKYDKVLLYYARTRNVRYFAYALAHSEEPKTFLHDETILAIARYGCVDSMRMLLQAGCEQHAEVVRYAVMSNSCAMLDYLLANGWRANDAVGYAICARGNVEMLKIYQLYGYAIGREMYYVCLSSDRKECAAYIDDALNTSRKRQ